MEIKKNKYYKKLIGPNSYAYRYILSHIPDDDIFLTTELVVNQYDMHQYDIHPYYNISFNTEYNKFEYEEITEIDQEEYENIARILVMNIYNCVNINININDNNNSRNKYYKLCQYDNPAGIPSDYLYLHVKENSLNKNRLIIHRIEELHYSLAGDLYTNNPFGPFETDYSIFSSLEKDVPESKELDEISQEEYETFVKKLLVNIYNIVNIHKNKKLQL